MSKQQTFYDVLGLNQNGDYSFSDGLYTSLEKARAARARLEQHYKKLFPKMKFILMERKVKKPSKEKS